MKKAKANKTIIKCTLMAACASLATASFAEEPIDRLNQQLAAYPQEKIHVMTDRDVYCGGDTVWMRLFIVDAATHRPVNMSRYAYAELRDPFGNVEKRVKILENDGIYAGYLPLNEDMPQGDYTLTAYTAFMENAGEEYFYKRIIPILSPLSTKYTINAEFEPSGEGRVKGNFTLLPLGNSPMRFDKMKWEMPSGDEQEMPMAKNGFSRSFSKDKGETDVKIQFGDYSQFFAIPFPHEKTDVTFYPEGGYLVEGEMCRVAFKAVDENGFGVPLSGTITDDKGEVAAEFSTSHQGMGTVSFIPEASRTYHANYVNPDGSEGRAEVGRTDSSACVLRVAQTPSQVTFETSGPSNAGAMELLVACRGAGLLKAPISIGESIAVDNSELPAGICQALLYSPADTAVLSERLFFIGADRIADADVVITSDSLSLQKKTSAGIDADCALRITNPHIAKTDVSSDIRTQMLLQSDLRGRIENPAQYFQKGKTANAGLDLIMMTNGWSRYDIPEALKGRLAEPQFPLEIGQEVSGKVMSRWRNKPIADAMVSAIVPQMGFGTYADTDENGEFHLNGFDFPEGTPFIIKVMNEKGGLEGNFEPYPDHFPEVGILRMPGNTADKADISGFFKGSQWTMLDEITVHGSNPKDKSIYEILASYSKTSKDFEKRGWNNIEEAMRSLPGLINQAGYLVWRGAPVGYYIDGTLCLEDGRSSSQYQTYTSGYSKTKRGNIYMPQSTSAPIDTRGIPSLNELSSRVPFTAIERIDFLRPEHSLFLERPFPGGVVMITTKSSDDKGWVRQYELKDFLPLGYQEHKEYASPLLASDLNEYELETQPTVLWIPSIKLSELSNLRLKHKIGPEHEVRLEGVSPDGQIIFTDSRQP